VRRPRTFRDLPAGLSAHAEACNIGLEPLVQPGHPALTRSRLSWVEQNYLRADTLTAANSRLVDAQNDIGLAQAWDGGQVASADRLRLVVPVRTLNADLIGGHRGLLEVGGEGCTAMLGARRHDCPRPRLTPAGGALPAARRTAARVPG